MDEKVKIGEFDVKKLEYINSLLTDTTRFGDGMQGQLNKINDYLSRTVRLGKELNAEELHLVENQMKRMEQLAKYNELLKAGNLSYESIAENYGVIVDLQNKLNEKFKTAAENRQKWSDISKDDIENYEILNDYMADGNKSIADAKEYLKEILDGTAKLRKNVADANIELEKTNSLSAKISRGLSNTEEFLGKIKRTFGIIKNVVVETTDDWRKFNEAAFKTTRMMGMSVKHMRAYQTSMMKNARDFGAAYGLAYDDLNKFQQQYNTVTQRNIILSRENSKALSAMHVLVGDDLMNGAIGEFDKLGGGLQTATAYTMKQYEVAERLGLHAGEAVSIMNKNMGMMNKYSFKRGVDGFQRMAILSQQLRFNMEAVSSAIEKASSLEGSIDMAASMQVLGGSYAAQFGNPLQVLYESLNDAEGFTERIINTFASKGNFNRETGMVEISAYNKAMMREAAKNLGMSYEEALNMANQAGKRNAAMREIDGSIKNKTERDMLANLATYNVDSGHFEVTVAGMDKPIKLADIKPEDIKNIKNNIIDDDLDTNVKKIYKLLAYKFDDRAKKSVSENENIEGIKTAKAGTIATVEDDAMIKAHEKIQDLGASYEGWSDGVKNFLGILGIAGPILQGATAIGGAWLGGKYVTRKLSSFGGSPGGFGRTAPVGTSTSNGGGGVIPGGASASSVPTNSAPVYTLKGKTITKTQNGSTVTYTQGRNPKEFASLKREMNRNMKGGTGRGAATAAGNASKIRGLSGKGVGLGMAAGLVGTGMEVLDNHLVQSGKIEQKGAADYALSVGGGALSGAATGAMIGSIIPGIGTGIGAAIGALAGGAISAIRKSSEEPVQPQPLDNTTAGQMVSGDIDLNVHGTIRIQYPNGASQDLVRELQRPDIQNAIKNIVVREMAKANAGGAIVNRGSQEMIRQGA